MSDPELPHETPASQASKTPPPTPAAILRPALQLWIGMWIMLGASRQLWWLSGLGTHANADSIWLFYGFAEQVVMAVMIVWFVRTDAEARRVLSPLRRGVVEPCFVLGAAALLVMNLWSQVWIETDVVMGPWSSFPESAQGWPFVATLLVGSVMPALFEEWMYRGLILTRLRQVVGVPMAIVLQAMLFAVDHMEPSSLLQLFFFGAVAGVLRQTAGALWPCMLMHGAWNAWLVLADYGIA